VEIRRHLINTSGETILIPMMLRIFVKTLKKEPNKTESPGGSTDVVTSDSDDGSINVVCAYISNQR
jgi:hypothetical protein